MKEKLPNYRLRSRLWKFLGTTTILTTTVGGFVAYESIIDWENFQQELNNFVVVSESAKLNLVVAIPFLISFVVFFFIMMKKNKTYLADKATLSTLLSVVVVYLIYSVVEVVLFSMIGALGGVMIDEFVLSPISAVNKRLADEQHQEVLEERKERIRVKVRKDMDDGGSYGSV